MDNFYASAATYIFGKNKKNEWCILIGKRSGHNPKYSGGLWNVPVGMCEENEPILQTAHRECKEETGLNIPISLFQFANYEKWGHGNNGSNFVVILDKTIDNYKITKGDWENSKFQWVPMEKIGNYKWAFNMDKMALKLFKKFINGYNIESVSNFIAEEIIKKIKLLK